MLTIVLLGGSCSAASSADPVLAGASQRPCGEKRFLMRVSDQDGPVLDGVQISTVSEDGIHSLVKTSFDQGDTCLDSSILQDPKVRCILFCREGYHCGAIIPKKELLNYWELKIALARIMI